ncbi:MAG: hypothetical protein KIT22_04770 [Verrucomicrobiae bacterium]|nr:hypothetical protein [Verrucomicrobiae bacterium]
MNNKSKVTTFVKWCQKNSIISLLIIAGLILISFGNVADSATKLRSFAKTFFTRNPQAEVSQTTTPLPQNPLAPTASSPPPLYTARDKSKIEVNRTELKGPPPGPIVLAEGGSETKIGEFISDNRPLPDAVERRHLSVLTEDQFLKAVRDHISALDNMRTVQGSGTPKPDRTLDKSGRELYAEIEARYGRPDRADMPPEVRMGHANIRMELQRTVEETAKTIAYLEWFLSSIR